MTKEEFKFLFDSYFDSVRSYLVYRGAGADDASDIAQDVFIRVWEKQLDIEPKAIKQLLYKIAGDMHITKYRRDMLAIKYIAQQNNDAHYSLDDEMDHNELFLKYNKAIAHLNEKQRTVFLMSRMDGLKYTEIAERLNLSIKAVEKRMSQALLYLKKTLL